MNCQAGQAGRRLARARAGAARRRGDRSRAARGRARLRARGCSGGGRSLLGRASRAPAPASCSGRSSHRQLHAALRILHGQLRRHPHGRRPRRPARALAALAGRYRLRAADRARPLAQTGRARGFRSTRASRAAPACRWRERRAAARAANPPAGHPSGDGLFLGYRLGGDALLPARRGRVYLPLSRLAHHLLVAGATGSGKTETVLRLADSLARRATGRSSTSTARATARRWRASRALMAAAGRRVWLLPRASPTTAGAAAAPRSPAGCCSWSTSPSEGGGAYYRDLAVNAIRLACDAPPGRRAARASCSRRLSRDALVELHPKGSPTAAELASVPARPARRHPRPLRRVLRHGRRLARRRESPSRRSTRAYFLLDGLRAQARGRLPRPVPRRGVHPVGRRAQAARPASAAVVDEFSAIARAGHGLVDVVERTRGFGVAAVLCPQLAEGMGGRRGGRPHHRLGPDDPAACDGDAGALRRRPPAAAASHATTRQLEGDAPHRARLDAGRAESRARPRRGAAPPSGPVLRDRLRARDEAPDHRRPGRARGRRRAGLRRARPRARGRSRLA